MGPQPSVSRRLFLLAFSAEALASCVTSDPTFIYEAPPVAALPAKMQRLLLWLPPNDDRIDATNLSAAFSAALAPYGVAVETGRATSLELARGTDQKGYIDRFNPNYRLEIDIAEGASATRGSQSAMSVILKGVLYRGAGRTPLARFDFHARSKKVPELATQVVEKWKAGGYL